MSIDNIKSELLQKVSNSVNRIYSETVNKEVRSYTNPKLSNIIDIYVALDTSRKSDESIPSEAIYSFDINRRFTQDNGTGIHTSDTLENIIEVQFSEIMLPDYGEYRYYVTTTDPPLVNNAANPPAFTRTPYGIVVVEYKELIHLLSAITTNIGNHVLFRAVVEGNKLRLIPLFDRVTFKTPQIIDKTITLSFTDQKSRLSMMEDMYKNVFICVCQHNNGVGPFPNSLYLGIMIDRSVIFADDRIYIENFYSPSNSLNDYVTNRGGLYISADYRTVANRSDIVFTNPAIQVNGLLDIGVTATRESVTNIENSVYNNALNGINATLTVVNPVGNYFDQAINVGDRVLVKNQSNLVTNGVYDVISLIPLVLQRANMNVRYGTIITVNSITTKYYYISQKSSDTTLIVGNNDIVFKEVPFNTQLYTNVVGILSYPTTVRVMNRSFFIPIRYRKYVQDTSNGILPV